MNKTRSNNKGFGLIAVLLVVVIVAVLGAAGWYVYQASTVTHGGYTANSAQNISASSVPVGWTWYVNKDLGFKYAYPKTWVATNTPHSSASDCPFIATGYGDATECPLSGSFSPQSYINFQTKKYGGIVNPLVNFWVFQKSSRSLSDLYSGYQFDKQPLDGYKPKPSSYLNINGLKGFYVNQVNSAFSDNDYVIQVTPGTFIDLTNRESDSNASTGANDYTQYSATVRQIIMTFSKA